MEQRTPKMEHTAGAAKVHIAEVVVATMDVALVVAPPDVVAVAAVLSAAAAAAAAEGEVVAAAAAAAAAALGYGCSETVVAVAAAGGVAVAVAETAKNLAVGGAGKPAEGAVVAGACCRWRGHQWCPGSTASCFVHDELLRAALLRHSFHLILHSMPLAVVLCLVHLHCWNVKGSQRRLTLAKYPEAGAAPKGSRHSWTHP